MSEQTDFKGTGGSTVADRVSAFKATRDEATALQSKAEPQANYDPEFDIEDHTNNSSGDEDMYGEHFRFIGSFTKLLLHDDQGRLAASVADRIDSIAEYRKLIAAMKFDSDPNSTQTNGDINHVLRAYDVRKGNGTLPPDVQEDDPQRVWINPQSAFSFSLKGGDISFFKMRKAPALRSKENAAEMIEVYLQTLCRDVSFSDYGTGMRTDKYKFPDGEYRSITNFACEVLNDFGNDFRGAKNARGKVTPDTLFRGVAKTDGGQSSDLIGDYVSQFLLQPLFPLFPAGCAPFVGGLIGVNNLNQEALAKLQHYPVAGPREFGISLEEFVQIQNGEIPRPYEPSDYEDYGRYLKNGRDMGSLVHTDGPYEAYYNALNILVYNDCPRCTDSPYFSGAIGNQGDGHTFGPPDIYCLIADVCLEAFKAAWAQKWRLHRKLRPEAMGRIMHRHLRIENHDERFLHPSAYTGKAELVLEMINERNKAQAECCSILSQGDPDTFLLAQMYPEGSPAHPAYPSGHATVAGACTTVIKAIFDDQLNFHEWLGNDGEDKTKISRPNPESETRLASIEDTFGYNHFQSSRQIIANMTVGSELDKLASNIALGRNFGGVHYRQDGDEGILLGENVAIKFLQDRVRTYTENASLGYTLTRRNGQRIRITADKIELVGGSTPTV